MSKSENGQMTAVHLCCGAGGITLGFEQEGIKTVYAFDVAPVAVETHRLNFPDAPVEVRDIRDVQTVDFPWADVWTCGIPCEMHSVAGKMLGERDGREISGEVARLILELQGVVGPRYIFLENVPRYASSVGAAQIRAALASSGFLYIEAIFPHADYGVCQTRKRWHLIASRVRPVPFPVATHSEESGLLGQLPWVRFGEIREREIEEPRYMSARALKGIIRRQRRKTQRGIEMGCGVHAALYVVEDDDLMYTVMASAHKGISRNQAVVVFDDYRYRLPTELECTRAQGFPDDFQFCGTKRQRYEQLGCAVPPPFAAAVGRAMVEVGEDRDGR